MELELLTVPFPFSERPPRSEGVHLYDVIKSLMDQVTESYELTETDRMVMELGFIWERTLELGWKDLLGKRPDEIEVEGIIGSPDGWLEDEGVLEEYKFTKKSTKWSPQDNPRWMLQVKGYCYMLASKLGRPVTEVRFHILHVNGDYKTNVPQYKVWRIQFTWQEVCENWQVVTAHAKKVGLIE